MLANPGWEGTLMTHADLITASSTEHHLGAETQNIGQWRRTSDRYFIRRAHPALIGRSVWLSVVALH